MNKIIEIAKEIKEQGGTAFIVGGFVRDMILKRKSKDIDVEVFGLDADALVAILERHGDVVKCGASFGVFKLGEYDFALPRTEKKVGNKHVDFEVIANPHMPKHEASLRRDLTINALMFNPLTGEVIDNHNGLAHLEEGIIKHVNDATFAEDALRILRVAQFSARFNFGVHEDTKELCVKLLPELQYISKERFMIEIEKILMKSENPSIAFRFMNEIGLLELFFPELHTLVGIEQGKKHHPEGNVFEHTMLALDSVPMNERELDIMLAILVHDMGKAVVTVERESDEVIHFFGHAEEGEAPVRSFMSRITNDLALIEKVVTLTKFHMRAYDFKSKLDRRSLRRLALKVSIPDLMKVHIADKRGRLNNAPELSYVEAILSLHEDIANEIKPIIKGRDLINLGLMPSKEFKAILAQVFEAQLEDEFSSHEEGVEFTKVMLGLA